MTQSCPGCYLYHLYRLGHALILLPPPLHVVLSRYRLHTQILLSPPSPSSHLTAAPRLAGQSRETPIQEGTVSVSYRLGHALILPTPTLTCSRCLTLSEGWGTCSRCPTHSKGLGICSRCRPLTRSWAHALDARFIPMGQAYARPIEWVLWVRHMPDPYYGSGICPTHTMG